MSGKDLVALQAEVAEYQREKGWDTVEKTFAEDCALIHSEVSEAFEAWRKSKGDVGSELADVFIRLLGACVTWGYDLQAEFDAKMAVNRTREYRHGGLPL